MAGPQDGDPRPGGTSPWSSMGLGIELAVPVVLGGYVGFRLDRRLGTAPWLAIGGALLGMVVGFYGFFKAVLPRRGGR